MTPSKLIKKLFKHHNNKEISDTSTPTPTPTHASPPSNPLSTPPQQLTQPRPQPASNLLSLPAELRNKIYTHAIYPSLPSISIHAHPPAVLTPPIFRVSQQTRAEALAILCETKELYISGLTTAVSLFEMLGPATRSLRRVTIRCEAGWREEGARMERVRREVVRWLCGATGVRQLTVVVGECRLSLRDGCHLEDVESVGVRFLYAVRDAVDAGVGGVQEGSVTKEGFLGLCGEVGKVQAVRVLREEVRGEHERREERVFRLRKVVSLEGRVEKLELPVRMPGCLRKTAGSPEDKL